MAERVHSNQGKGKAMGGRRGGPKLTVERETEKKPGKEKKPCC